MHPLTSLSPLDGRYASKIAALQPFFSELALMRYRVMVEVEYLIALSKEKKIKEIKSPSTAAQKTLRQYYKKFSLADGEKIKLIETTTNHDVKAIEYWLKEKLADTPLKKYLEFIHFALTSEDVNNLAYSLMWRDGLQKVYLPALEAVYASLHKFALAHRREPMLALTHGQPATPTTVGKEFAVFAARLKRQIDQLKQHRLLGKLNGATGTWAAHCIAYPQAKSRTEPRSGSSTGINWPEFSKKFVLSLNLQPNLITTQIEAHDSLAENFDILMRINTILLDCTRDIWLYISRGVLGQKKKEGEIGSSTMPHKINPIHFENAEGNLGLSNALLSHLAAKLPISRMQRDLSDSTVLRNNGVALGHSLLACKYIMEGMSRLTINKEKLNEELEAHWEVLAEPIQVVLRKVGHQKPYEKLKELTRGQHVGKEEIRKFIQELDIQEKEKNKLLKLTPQAYTGLASKLVK